MGFYSSRGEEHSTGYQRSKRWNTRSGMTSKRRGREKIRRWRLWWQSAVHLFRKYKKWKSRELWPLSTAVLPLHHHLFRSRWWMGNGWVIPMGTTERDSSLCTLLFHCVWTGLVGCRWRWRSRTSSTTGNEKLIYYVERGEVRPIVTKTNSHFMDFVTPSVLCQSGW